MVVAGNLLVHIVFYSKTLILNLIVWNSCIFFIDRITCIIRNSGEQLCVMCILPTKQIEIKVNSNRLSLHTYTQAHTLPTNSSTHRLFYVDSSFRLCLHFSYLFSRSGVQLCLPTKYPNIHVIASRQCHTFLLHKQKLQLLLYLFK